VSKIRKGIGRIYTSTYPGLAVGEKKCRPQRYIKSCEKDVSHKKTQENTKRTQRKGRKESDK
jgi:hypothetical protein